MDKKKTPLLERLTAEQQDRLKSLTFSMCHSSMTASFSLDVRDLEGCKRSVFFSLTTKAGGEDGYWSQADMRIVRCLLSKEVVGTVYDDAVRRHLMPATQAGEEMKPIMAAYDQRIEKLLGVSDD